MLPTVFYSSMCFFFLPAGPVDTGVAGPDGQGGGPNGHVGRSNELMIMFKKKFSRFAR